jgi:carbonic anhydrase
MDAHNKSKNRKLIGGCIEETIRRDNMNYLALLEGNRKFVQQKLNIDPEYFKKHVHEQKPKYVLIGCSDSRVSPDQLTNTEPGEIFMHRNIANIVVSSDMNVMSVLSYAIEVLKVKHVIVMGHYGCGGVRASMDNQYHGVIDKWLRHIKDVQRLYWNKLQATKSFDERFRLLVELNVKEQALNICKTPMLQRAWANGENIHVHAWVYDLETGLIRDLEIEEHEWHDIAPIYKLNSFAQSKL